MNHLPKLLILAAACAAFALTHPAAAAPQVYKCRGIAGQTVYQDEPCAGQKSAAEDERERRSRAMETKEYTDTLQGLERGTLREQIQAAKKYEEWHAVCNVDGNSACKLTDGQFRRLVDAYYKHLERARAEVEVQRQQNQLNYAQRRRQEGLRIGMSADDVRSSATWGYPEEGVNRTVTAFGTREQWIYRSGLQFRSIYLYFDNERLSSIQSTN